MSNNINIQRGSKNSQDKIGKPLFNTSGKSPAGVKETLNNLTFIYNNYGNAHNPFTYNRDGIYVGNNVVAGTTRVYYSKDLATSLQFHQTMMNYKSSGSSVSGKTIQPGFVGDTGMIHFMMPGANFDVISSSLSFRNLDEASYSFGDVNNILSYYPKDYVENDPTNHGGFTGDANDWADIFNGGEKEANTESFNWTDKTYTGDIATADTATFDVFKHSDTGTGDLKMNEDVVKSYLGTSDKDGNTYVDLSSDQKDSIFNDLVGSVKNSVESAGIYNVEGTVMSDAWTKIMTNAYFGIISDVQYNPANKTTGTKTAAPVRNTGSSLDGAFKIGDKVQTGKNDAYLDNTTAMAGGYKSDNWQAEYNSINNTNTTENNVHATIGEATEGNSNYYNYLYGTGSNNGSATTVTVSDLFSSGSDTVAVKYDGTVAPVTNSSDYTTYIGDDNKLNTVIQTLDSCTYHPQNVFDEISHLFQICDENFVALGQFVTQTNKMLVDDVAAKLIPAIAANVQTGIAQVQYKVNSLAVQQAADTSTLNKNVSDVSTKVNDVSSKLTDVSTKATETASVVADVSLKVGNINSNLSNTNSILNSLNTRFKNFTQEYHFTGKRLYGPIVVEPGETYKLDNEAQEILSSMTIGCVEVFLSGNSIFRWEPEYNFTDKNGTCAADDFQVLVLSEEGHYIVEPAVYVMLSESSVSEAEDGNGEKEEEQTTSSMSKINFLTWSQYANSDISTNKKVRVEYNVYKYYPSIGGWSAYVPGADDGYITVVDLDS